MLLLVSHNILYGLSIAGHHCLNLLILPAGNVIAFSFKCLHKDIKEFIGV